MKIWDRYWILKKQLLNIHNQQSKITLRAVNLQAMIVKFPTIHFSVVVRVRPIDKISPSLLHSCFSHWLLLYLFLQPVLQLLSFKYAALVSIPFFKDLRNILGAEILRRGGMLIYLNYINAN